MYRGNNPTAIQSQNWLAESLIVLMEEKPFSQITVQDICKKADLSRQTFYNFFSAKEEILRYCLQQKYEEQFSKYSDSLTISIGEIVEAFTDVLTENKQLLNLMVNNGLDGIIADEISKCISLFANRFVNSEHSKEILPYSESLLSGALAHLLVFWFQQEKPISQNALNEILTDFLDGNLYKIS